MAALGEYQRERQKIDAQAVQMHGRQRQACILLVDDDERVAEMGREMLVYLGVEVVVNTCSLKALQTFQEDPQGFDLVLTDLEMLYMTGAALACKLWQIRPDMPIVLCTGSSTMTWSRAQLLGFGFFLRKPFGLSDIAFAVEQVLPQRMALVS
jgi:CheY-like chemotaxis protein